MKYGRALLLTELGADARPALSALRRVAPQLEQLLLVVRLPESTFAWLTGAGAPAAEQSWLDTLRELAAQAAPSSQLQLAPDLSVEALGELVKEARIDLLVAGSQARPSIALLTAVQKREALALLSADELAAPGPALRICCITFGQRGRETIGRFLRAQVEPNVHVTVLSPGTPAPDELASLLEVAGVANEVEMPPLDATTLRRSLQAWLRGVRVDLFVFARVPASLLIGATHLSAPVLLLPPSSAVRPFWERAIDVPDLVDMGGPLLARVDYVATVGDLAAVPDQALTFVSGGRALATVTTRAGSAVLPVGVEASSFGLFRAGEAAAADPVAAIEQWVSVVRAGQRPLTLFDSQLSDDALRSLREQAAHAARELLAVRLRPTHSCRSIRERLRRFALAGHVVDARAVLDEGEALDVSEELDGVRLSRVATRLRGVGFPVSAIAHRGPIPPLCRGFVAVTELALRQGLVDLTRDQTEHTDEATDFPWVAGNHVELELDNARARGWLLDAIASSQETVHLQVYMVGDDDVGGAVERALAEAGARGVRVRVLVDSLHGFHGSFGISNSLLERLSRQPGVEVRTSRPITEAPSLTELKQRDHRKLVVVDGRLALLGGRNLSHEYYTPFEEAQLTPHSLWREVPWLDAGARVEGPLVARLSASFLEAWGEAGGSGFSFVTPPAAGSTTARLITHRGLRDAHTLETYLALIAGARSHLYVINGFPLMLELQHALLGALRRGVRVRALVGHLTPTHGGEPFKGAWGPARIAGTELVHSRFDALSEAGGEVYYFAVPELPSFRPGLGAIQPHVHAKLVSVDGLRCSVGSANLDITSAYWESELLLVLEDAALTAALELRLEALLQQSLRIDREDPAWQQLARRRAWLRHWPGVLAL